MTARRQLCLTVVGLLVLQTSGLQTSSANKTACESSNVTISFNYDLEGEGFLDRSWLINSNILDNRIARVDSAGNQLVEPKYMDKAFIAGEDKITLRNVSKMDSARYLFLIVTDGNSIGTATTTVNVFVNPNKDCKPIIENNSAGNFTCRTSDACNQKDSIETMWDDGSVDTFICPTVTKDTEYKCCAKGNSVTYCYSGSLCTEIVCTASGHGPGGCGIGCVIGIVIGVCLGILVSVGCVVIFLKTVKIQDKDVLQKPVLKGSEVTIKASVCGLYKSDVKWIGPNGDIKATKGKRDEDYNKKSALSGLSTLKISNLEVKDSGLYTCHAKRLCGSSAQDSVTITVHDPNDQKNEEQNQPEESEHAEDELKPLNKKNF